MTREEAKKICSDTFNSKCIEAGDANIDQFLNMLEALGLIRFEEPKEDKRIHQVITHARNNTGMDGGTQRNFIKYLNNRGYQIVRKDNAT